MADGIALPATTGTVATEEITTLNGGGVSARHVQRNGLVNITADGVASDVAASSPLPVVASPSAYSSGIVSATRPSNGTPYGAGDIVGATAAAWTFPTMGPAAGGKVMITSAALRIDDSALISGEAAYRLHLYNVTPPSAAADNAVFDLPSGDRASYLGFIDLGTPEDLVSTLYHEVNGINKQVVLASGSLFGYLQTIGAYTPTSARVYNVILHSVAI